MAQQTAVEWLIEQMLKPDMYKIWPTLLERAKEMEKKQIVVAYSNGSNDRLKNRINEQYYKETYGS